MTHRRLEYTGERIVPDVPACRPGTLIYDTHVARYDFAAHYVDGKTVLDLACGVGYGSRRLVDAGGTIVIGGDIASEAIEYAIQHYATDRTKFIVMNAEAIPLPPHSVDCVVSFETLEHLPDPGRFLDEVTRVLRLPGTLIVSTPNRSTYGRDTLVPDNRFHTREYTPGEFEVLLARYFSRTRLFSQRRLARRSRIRVGVDALARWLRAADRMNLRHVLPLAARAALGAAADAYERDCSVLPAGPDDEPLFIIGVAQQG